MVRDGQKQKQKKGKKSTLRWILCNDQSSNYRCQQVFKSDQDWQLKAEYNLWHNNTIITTTVLRPLHWSACRHALADGNQRTQIREKTLEFSSTVLSTLSLCPEYSLCH